MAAESMVQYLSVDSQIEPLFTTRQLDPHNRAPKHFAQMRQYRSASAAPAHRHRPERTAASVGTDYIHNLAVSSVARHTTLNLIRSECI